MTEEETTASVRKPLTKKERRVQQVIRLVGTMRPDEICAIVDIGEATFYRYLAEIRNARGYAIGDEFVDHVAQEQYNRRNSLVQILYDDMMACKKKVDKLRETLETMPGGNPKLLEKEERRFNILQNQYSQREYELSGFLNLVGVYQSYQDPGDEGGPIKGIIITEFPPGMGGPPPKVEREINPIKKKNKKKKKTTTEEEE